MHSCDSMVYTIELTKTFVSQIRNIVNVGDKVVLNLKH